MSSAVPWGEEGSLALNNQLSFLTWFIANLLPFQETSLEKLPWSYQENTYIGRLNEDLMKTIINSCRRKPFVLICGSSTFNEDMSRYLKAAGIKENSCFVF